MHSNYKLTAAALLMLLLAACGGKTSVPLSDERQRTLGIVWEEEVGVMSPLQQAAITNDGSRVCTVSHSGDAFLLSTADGSRERLPIKFPNPDSDNYTAGAGCAGDIIAAVSGSGWLRVYSAIDGLLWQKDLKTRVFGAPLLAKGKIFVIGLDGRLLAYTLKHGRELWRYVSPLENLLRTPLDSSLIISNDTVYGGIDNGALVALDQSNGRVQWENIVSIAKSENVVANILDVTTPILHGNTICTAAYQSGIACFNTEGRRLWHYSLSAYTRAAFSPDGKQIYVTDIDGTLYALQVASGELLWRQKTGLPLSAPLVVGDTVLVGDGEGNIHTFFYDNGEIAGVLDTGGSKIIQLLPLPQSPNAFMALSLDGLLFRIEINS